MGKTIEDRRSATLFGSRFLQIPETFKWDIEAHWGEAQSFLAIQQMRCLLYQETGTVASVSRY